MPLSLQQIYNQILDAYRTSEQKIGHHHKIKETRREVFVSRCLKSIYKKPPKQLNYIELRALINKIIDGSSKSSELVFQIARLLHELLNNPNHVLFEDRDQGELFNPKDD